MAKKTPRVDMRIMVSQTNLALFDHLSGFALPSSEAIRLMQIGLKWAAVDSDPRLLLSYLAGVPVAAANHAAPAQHVAAPQNAVPVRNPTKAASAAELLMADFGGDLMAMFDGPPMEALAA